MRRVQYKLGRGSRILFLTVLGGLTCLSSGCGGGTSMTPVKGKVTVNGQPMTAGHVIFHPNKDKANTFGGVCVSEINAQGEYTLQTKGKPGAPLGWYKVTVTATEAPPDNTKATTASPINTTYALPDITPLEIEVVEKAPPGKYDLKLGP